VLPRAAELRAGAAAGQVVVSGVALEISWVGEGWLRDVRGVLARQRRPDVVAARRISPGAAAVLRDAGIGFVDETGAAEIAVGGIVVSRTGRELPGPRPAARWTPAVLGVAEAILCGTRPTVAAVQEATGLSTGSCAQALRLLTDRGLLEAAARRGRGSGRSIADVDRLVDAYATAAATAADDGASLKVGVSWRDPVAGVADLGHRWSAAGVDWAVTGLVAAAVLAPHLTSYAGAQVYIDTSSVAGLEAAAHQLELRPIEGGRLTLSQFPTPATARLVTTVEGLRVAPWPRVYADLRPLGVRGEEAAEHLSEVMRG
jgi:hypothetical protein